MRSGRVLQGLPIEQGLRRQLHLEAQDVQQGEGVCLQWLNARQGVQLELPPGLSPGRYWHAHHPRSLRKTPSIAPRLSSG